MTTGREGALQLQDARMGCGSLVIRGKVLPRQACVFFSAASFAEEPRECRRWWLGVAMESTGAAWRLNQGRLRSDHGQVFGGVV